MIDTGFSHNKDPLVPNELSAHKNNHIFMDPLYTSQILKHGTQQS